VLAVAAEGFPSEVARLSDDFPGVLEPPIVLVDRDEEWIHEKEITALVEPFGGTWAGT
jgi:hypothetical protein